MQKLKKRLSLTQIHRYYLFTFLKDMGLFSAVLVPFFTSWGHISLFQVQLLQSWFMFWFFALEVPTGAVADYLGRKWSLVLGAAILSIACLVYGSIPSFAIFLLAEFLFAVSTSLISGADEAWLYDHLITQGKAERSKHFFGKAESIHLLGMLVGAPIGSLVARFISLNAPMYLSAIPAIVAVLVSFSLQEPATHTGPSETKRYGEIVIQGLTYLKNHRLLRKLTFDAICVTCAGYFVIWLYQPLLEKLSVPIFYFGFVQAALLTSEIIISRNFAFFERVIKRIQYAKLSAGLTILGFLAVTFFPNYLTAGIFIVLAGGFGMTRLTYFSAQMQHHIPSAQRATILSFISMFRRLALVILNPIVGLIATKSLSGALLIVGLIPVISLLIIYKPEEKAFSK